MKISPIQASFPFNRRGIMNHKSILFLLTILSSPLGAEGELIAVSAIQKNEEIIFTIKNISSETVFISNPQKTSMMVGFVSEKANGGLELFRKGRSKPWKHLVVLTGAAEDMPHNWSWRFTAKPDESPGTFKKLEVWLWIATEKDFVKAPLSSLHLVKFPVEISRP